MSNETGEIKPEIMAEETHNPIENAVKNFPVPNQLPTIPDLSHLPEDILRSSTVETLIHQNEDLLSRLSISLRRASQWEEKLNQLEKKNRILEHKLGNLDDQLLIYKQKDDVIQGTYQKYETQIADLKKDLRLFETQYTELYSTSNQKSTDQKDKILQLSKRIARFSRYRKRIQKVSENFRGHFADVLEEKIRLQNQLTEIKESQRTLKQTMSSMVERIQQQEKEHKIEIGELTQTYEKQINNSQIAQAELNEEIAELRCEILKFENTEDKIIEVENQLLSQERKMQSQKEQSASEIQTLQEQLSEYRGQAKSRAIEIERLSGDHAEQAEKLEAFQDENAALKEQVESLQVLWRDNNLELEKANEKNESLQKLNQQISLSLNEARRALTEERNKKEIYSFQTKEKMRELEMQIGQLSRQSAQTQPDHSEIQPQIIHHIEKLIAEVQSGVDSGTKEGISTGAETTSSGSRISGILEES